MEGIFDNFMDWIGNRNKPGTTATATPPGDAVSAIRAFPVEAAKVAKLQERAARLRNAIQGAANVPVALRLSVGGATLAANKAAASLAKYRDEVKKAIAEAKAQGKLSSADESSLRASGLGYLGAFPGETAPAGSLPFVLVSSPSAAMRVARGFNAKPGTTVLPIGGEEPGIPAGGKGVGYLGFIPLAVIGIGVALTLAAAAVAGTIVVAYRATSEDAARADAITKTAEAGLEAWKAQGGRPNEMPTIPGERSNIAGAALSLGTLAIIGIGAYFLLRKKGK